MSFSDELNELLQQGKDLPTLPDTILELRTALDDDMVSDRRIADIIGRDPVITGKLLRVANSVMYSRGMEVTSVLNAVQRVGLREVRAICVVLAVIEAFKGAEGAFNLRQFWDHSAAVGRVGQMLCRRVGLNGGVEADDVYVAGLLHDVGILLMSQFFPDLLADILAALSDSETPLWTIEQRVLGMTHGEIGGRLIERWSLPASISICVSAHHAPENAPEDHRQACQILHASETLCTSLGADVSAEGIADDDPFSALSNLELPADQIESVLGEIEEVGLSVRGILS
jgi:HD-like signal output (HDOD) protein